ncbi:MAG TPA: hypothetical protein PLB78_05645 [Anaerolineae bacterium]|nr:hypothetical protein [Anaerolineae bacterium]
MGQHNDLTTALPVEGALRELYAAAPEPAFVAGLEQRLIAQARSLPAYNEDLHREGREGRQGMEGSLLSCLRALLGPAHRTLAPFASFAVQTSRRRWAVGAAGLVLALAVALLAAGPAEVLAQVQRLLGYVPGIGFVDLDQACVLAAPEALTREGVTLTVEQVVARPNGTTMAIRAAGLPPLVPVEAGEAPALRLADGTVLAHTGYQLRYGAGTIQFPALPEEVYRATLVLPRLPLVPAGAAPEGWEVPLVLRAATGELAAALFPQPYRPAAASDSHEGVALRVLDVAQGAEETAVRLALEWQDARAYASAIGGSAYLRDDLGHVYGVATRPGNGSFVETEVIAIDPAAPRPTPAPATREETLAFTPVSPQARELTLLLNEIHSTVPAAASITVDLGAAPRVGDSWPLDVDLDVVGVPVHVSGARLVEEVAGPREAPERRRALEFDLVLPPGEGSRALTSLSLDGGAAGFGGAGCSGGMGRMTAAVYVGEGEPLPQGRAQVLVREAMLSLRGPWTVSWPVPGAEPVGVSPAVLRPMVSQRRGEIVLRLDEAVLSDRLTSLHLSLAEAPAGVTLSGRDSFAAAPGEGATLTDDRGRDYGRPNAVGVRWLPAGATGPELDTLTFAPLQPLARRLTLKLPALRLAWPGAAAFDVDVPAGDGRRGRGSAPWAVDIPLEVAGYRLRFAEARLVENGNTTALQLTSAPYTSARERQLTGLRLAAITAPGGRVVDVTSMLSAAGPLGQREQTALLLFDVTEPESGAVQPGCYHVELSGATAAVRGPWELSWEVGQ